MMFGRRRVEILEHEVAALRAAIAELRGDVRTGGAVDAERAQAAHAIEALGRRLTETSERALAQGDRSAAIEHAFAQVERRLDTLDVRQAASDESAARLAQAVEALIAGHSNAGEAVKARDQEMRKFWSTIVALDLQIKLQAEEMTRLAAGLMERITRRDGARHDELASGD